MTFTQEPTGTYQFMPPESFTGEVSPGWDVWSLGVLIVYALTKQYPFPGASLPEIMSAIMAKEPRIISPLPKPFDAIVRGCLVKDRRSRWTAQQVLAALDGSAVSLPRNPTLQPTAKTIYNQPSHPPVPPQKSTAWPWAAFAGVAVVGGLLWNALGSNNRTPSASPTPAVSYPYTPTPLPVSRHARRTARSAHSNRHRRSVAIASLTRGIQHLRYRSITPVTVTHVSTAPAALIPHPTRTASSLAAYSRPVFFHHASQRSHLYHSSIGDLHSTSSIGNGSLHGNNGNSSSESSSISGGLH